MRKSLCAGFLFACVLVFQFPASSFAFHPVNSEGNICNPVHEAEIFFNASGWFLKITVFYDKGVSKEHTFNLKDEKVDVNIGWQNMVCFVHQYPKEYISRTTNIIFVPSHVIYNGWVSSLERAEQGYLQKNNVTTPSIPVWGGER